MSEIKANQQKTKSHVNSNPNIPPNPTSNHQPTLLRSYNYYYYVMIMTSFYFFKVSSGLWEVENVPENKSSVLFISLFYI